MSQSPLENVKKRHTRSALRENKQKDKQKEKQNDENPIDSMKNLLGQQQIEEHKEIIPRTHDNICPKKSNWGRKQKIRYFVFLKYYSQLSNWNNNSKSLSMFKMLSLFIRSRSPEQCKSFHLSVKRYFKTLHELIRQLYEQLSIEQNFQVLLKKYQIEIQSFQEQHKLFEENEINPKTDLKDKKDSQKQEHLKDQVQEVNASISQLQRQLPSNMKDVSLKFSISEMLDKQPVDYHHENQDIQQNILIESSEKNSHEQVKFNNVNLINSSSYQPQIVPSNQQANIQDQSIYFQGMRSNEQNFPFFPIKNMQQSFEENRRSMQMQINHHFSNFRNSLCQNKFVSFNQNSKILRPPIYSSFDYPVPPKGGFPYLFQNSNTRNLNNSFSNNYENYLSSQSRNMDLNLHKNKFKNELNSNFHINGPNVLRKINQKKQISQELISQKHRQLTLKCHKHWINWMYAVLQLQRRQQLTKNIPNYSSLLQPSSNQ